MFLLLQLQVARVYFVHIDKYLRKTSNMTQNMRVYDIHKQIKHRF